MKTQNEICCDAFADVRPVNGNMSDKSNVSYMAAQSFYREMIALGKSDALNNCKKIVKGKFRLQ